MKKLSEKKWESKDSNFSAYDLQSLLAAPASFPIAEGVGIEPCPEGPRQFSRLFAPMRGTIQAENCGHDPQSCKRSDSLAGCAYPSRLILQRDSNQNRTDIDIVLQTKPKTNIGYAVIVRMDGIEPPSTRFSVWHSTAELHPRIENKKAPEKSGAVYVKSHKLQVNTIQPRPLKKHEYELYDEQLSMVQI